MRVILVLVMAAFALPANAQFAECPFPESVAQADTLDPGGYKPFAPGYVWEYVRWSGCCLDRAIRREVMADTLISGAPYWVLRESHATFDETGDLRDSTTVLRMETLHRYLAVREGLQLEWTPERGEVVVRDLGMDFQSCRDDAGSNTTTVSWALPEASYVLNKAASPSTQPAVGKAFDEGGRQVLFQYGLGYVSSTSGDSVEVLTHAQLGLLEFGFPLSNVFGNPEVPPLRSAPGEVLLENYPNPFATSTTLDFYLPEDGKVTIHVVDILGRRVDVLLSEVLMSSGRHRIMWRPDELASGLYFIQLIHNGHVAATRSSILTR